MTDPMELLIASALNDAGIPFEVVDNLPEGLDFKIGNVFVEVKQFHSDRIAVQMARADNVIVAQGREAVEFLAALIRSFPRHE